MPTLVGFAEVVPVYAMVRRYRMGAGSIEDLVRTVDTRFADRAQADLGILGYQAVALDHRTIMILTLFATEEQLRAAEPMAGQVREGLAEFRVEALEVASGPVMVARGSVSLTEPIHPSPGTRSRVRTFPRTEGKGVSHG